MCFCLWACWKVRLSRIIVFVNVRERVGEWQTEALYIFALHVIRRPCSPEPPNTKCVWVAASGDKMAISTISQPSISFRQIDAVAGAYEWDPEIDWTETIRLSEQDDGWNLWNHREDSGGKWIICQILSKGERKQTGTKLQSQSECVGICPGIVWRQGGSVLQQCTNYPSEEFPAFPLVSTALS